MFNRETILKNLNAENYMHKKSCKNMGYTVRKHVSINIIHLIN